MDLSGSATTARERIDILTCTDYGTKSKALLSDLIEYTLSLFLGPLALLILTEV